jgi:hypothetical protein
MSSKAEPKLVVEIPRPGEGRPVWSRVGIIGLAGFVVGVAWPRLAGVKVGPSVPSDLAAKVEATAKTGAPARSAAPSASASAAASAAPAASGAPDEPIKPSNREVVVVGPGKITKCSDKKDKKIEDCGTLQFDPIAVKRLKELSKCPSALGLEGKMNIGFEINFDKKEVVVTRVKKGSSLPSSTVSGIVKCAGREFGNVSLEEVPHKHRHYTQVYGITFYPPGKAPPEEHAPSEGDGTNDPPAAGATTNQTDATGSAVVTWDTALVRKDPKDGEVVARVVRGTKVKILGKQNDWYKVDAGGKTGWVYRGSIGQ